MVKLPIQEPSNLKDPNDFRKLFGWSKETLGLLEWFPMEVLREEQGLKNRNLYREMVNELLNVLDSRTKNSEGPIFNRPTLHAIFNLRNQLEKVKKHLDKPMHISCPRPTKGKSLNWLQWTVWNLAPFFKHTPSTASKHIGHIAWPFLAQFLRLTVGKKALENKWKRKSTEEASQSGVDPMELTVNRLKQAYHRIVKKKIPRDTMIRSHLQASKQKKSPLDILLNPIHDQAYETLKKKLAEAPAPNSPPVGDI